jgi:hypothetical protein
VYDAESQELLEELQGTSEVQSVAFWDRDEQSLGITLVVQPARIALHVNQLLVHLSSGKRWKAWCTMTRQFA